MELKILIDNTPSVDGRLVAEHGLSLYFETGGKRCLLDTGLTGRAFDNARLMGVDIAGIDLLILSHGHVDHTGGLAAFIELNQRAMIYASRRIMEYDYTSIRRGKEHSLSADVRLLTDHAERFTWVDECLMIDDGLALVRCTQHLHAVPRGNRYLHVARIGSQMKENYRADDELAVTITEGEHRMILSPCSHGGMLNIIEACDAMWGKEEYTGETWFVGGLHLLDEEAAADNVTQLAQEATARYPKLRILTGHCTGEAAMDCLQEMMGERVKKMRTGLAFGL